MKKIFVLTLLSTVLLINTTSHIYTGNNTQHVSHSKECPQLGREMFGLYLPLIAAIGTKLATSSTEAAAVVACVFMAYQHATTVILPGLYHLPGFNKSTILKNIHDEITYDYEEIQTEAVSLTTILGPLIPVAVAAELLYKVTIKVKDIILGSVNKKQPIKVT